MGRAVVVARPCTPSRGPSPPISRRSRRSTRVSVHLRPVDGPPDGLLRRQRERVRGRGPIGIGCLLVGEDRRGQQDQLRERGDVHRERRPGRLVPVLVIPSAEAGRPSVLRLRRRYDGDGRLLRLPDHAATGAADRAVAGQVRVVLVVLALGIGLFARWVGESERASFARGHQRMLPSMSVGHLRGPEPVGTDAEAEEATRIALAAARGARGVRELPRRRAREAERAAARLRSWTAVDDADDRLGRGGSARLGGGGPRAEWHLLLGPRTPRSAVETGTSSTCTADSVLAFRSSR